nr:carboxypeptidase-like regulatory domain-containing protein [Gemmatimonadaceae bacterium]
MGIRTYLRLGFAALLLLQAVPTILLAQGRQISGRVTRSGSDQPVPDVQIAVINAAQISGARTNADGRYTITAPAGEVRLQIRAIGYTRREVTVPANTNTFDVVLVQDFFKLSEVVVTGQATTIERRSATTAIAYVTGEEIARVAAPT